MSGEKRVLVHTQALQYTVIANVFLGVVWKNRLTKNIHAYDADPQLQFLGIRDAPHSFRRFITFRPQEHV